MLAQLPDELEYIYGIDLALTLKQIYHGIKLKTKLKERMPFFYNHSVFEVGAN